MRIVETRSKKNTFVIIGLGWLGTAFAKAMLKKNHLVFGTTRSVGKDIALQQQGIPTWLFSLGSPLPSELAQVTKNTSVLISVSPSTQGLSPPDFCTALETLIQSLNQLEARNILFTSSTSVYPTGIGEVCEEDAVGFVSKKSGINLLEAEMRLQQASYTTPVSIVRLGGLFGPKRHPGKFFRSFPMTRAQDPVNVIHRDDGISILERLSQEPNSWLVNACSPIHPSKQEFYSQAASKLGLPAPGIVPPLRSASPKIVNSDRVINRLNYTFIHPDPISALDYC